MGHGESVTLTATGCLRLCVIVPLRTKVVFSRVRATPQPAMLVGRMIGRSTYVFLAFSAFFGVFCITAS